MFGVCLQTCWFGVYANVMHIPTQSPVEGVVRVTSLVQIHEFLQIAYT